MFRANRSRSNHRRKVEFLPFAYGIVAEMRLERRSLAAPGLIRPLAMSLLDGRSADGNAQATLTGLGLSLSSVPLVSATVAGGGQALPGAADSRANGPVSVSPDTTENEPEFFALADPTLMTASVTGTGGVDDTDPNELVSANAGATVTTVVQQGFLPPITLTQLGKATAAIDGPTVPGSGSGPSTVSATFALSNQQTVSGSIAGGGSNEMTTAVNGGRTYGLASTGPNSVNTTLVETFNYNWSPPIGSASVGLVGGGGFSTPNFSVSWFAGSTPQFSNINPASTVLEKTSTSGAALLELSTPVTLPVYPTVGKYSFAFSSDIESTLVGSVIGTNAESQSVTFSASLTT
jgi:hypothetical protein